MVFKLFKIVHSFAYRPNEIEVSLSLQSDILKNREESIIKVVLVNDNLQSLTLSEIEDLAVSRAKVILS